MADIELVNMQIDVLETQKTLITKNNALQIANLNKRIEQLKASLTVV